jgi:hypothetical protein
MLSSCERLEPGLLRLEGASIEHHQPVSVSWRHTIESSEIEGKLKKCILFTVLLFKRRGKPKSWVVRERKGCDGESFPNFLLDCIATLYTFRTGKCFAIPLSFTAGLSRWTLRVAPPCGEAASAPQAMDTITSGSKSSEQTITTAKD